MAIQAIIAHCNSRSVVKKEGYYRLRRSEDSSLSSEAEQDTSALVKRKLTEEDIQHLLYLKDHRGYSWTKISSQFPGWSTNALQYRYRKATSCHDPSNDIAKHHVPESASDATSPAKHRKTVQYFYDGKSQVQEVRIGQALSCDVGQRTKNWLMLTSPGQWESTIANSLFSTSRH